MTFRRALSTLLLVLVSPAALATPLASIGVDLGDSAGQVQAFVDAQGLACTHTPAYVSCARGKDGGARTYWIENGRLSRAYVVFNPDPNQASARVLKQFADLAAHMAGALDGLPPHRTVEVPAAFASLPDTDWWRALSAGQFQREIHYDLPGRHLALALRAEHGNVRLVLSLEPGPTCSGDVVARLLLDLFSPADAPTRAKAAADLGQCRVPKSAGALGMAVRHDPAEAVRVESLRALARLGDRSMLKEIGQDTAMPKALRTHARAALAEAPTTTPAAPAPAVVYTPLRPGNAPAATTAVATPGNIQPFEEPTPADTAPETPKGPPSGTPLAIAAATVAGGVWGMGMTRMAEQDGMRFLTLASGAGALIGGATAFGLTHFGGTPSPEQALFFANATAWGSLAGLMAYAGSGAESTKLKYGMLVGGEFVGMGLGVLGAKRWPTTYAQTALANSLALSLGLGVVGAERMLTPEHPLRVSPYAGYGTAPILFASLLLARRLDVRQNDVALGGVAAATAGWNTGLLASGIAGTGLFSGRAGQGGMLLGVGAGYVGTMLAAPYIDVPGSHALVGAGVSLLGNSMGLGIGMMAAPNADRWWSLGAGLGGVATLGAGALLAPSLRFDDDAPTLALATGGWTGATILAANAVAGYPTSPRLPGALFTLVPAAGIAGALVSPFVAPSPSDLVVTGLASGLGFSAGLGFARVASATRGDADFFGATAGSLVGLGLGAWAQRRSPLGRESVPGGLLGAGEGLLLGSLLPSLTSDYYRDDRRTDGGRLLGLSLGLAAGAGLSHALDARDGQVATLGAGAILGTGLGTGMAGLWASDTSRPVRVGAVAGSLGGMAGALVLDHTLGLSQGLGDAWTGFALAGTGVGLFEGALLPRILYGDDAAADRATPYANLFGASLGASSGLLLSTFLSPSRTQAASTLGFGLAGALAGQGLTMLAYDGSQKTRVGAGALMTGSLMGLAAGGLAARAVDFDGKDAAAASVGAGLGGIVGALAPSLKRDTFGSFGRKESGGLLLGSSLGAVAATALAHATDASAIAVGRAGLFALDGMVGGIGAGTLLDDGSSSRKARIGAVAGLGTGLALSLVSHTPGAYPDGTATFALGATAVGGLGLGLLPYLGHADAATVDGTHVRAAGMLGASAGSLLALSLAPRLSLDPDAIGNALSLGATLATAGASLGYATSDRDDATVMGILGGGTLGLLAGGAFHEHIDLSAHDNYFLGTATLEGAFLGGLLPNVLRTPGSSTGPTTFAGAAGGGLVGLATATLLARAADPDEDRLTLGMLGTATGASLAGGLALLSPDLSDRAGYALTLGGSVAGLGAGLLAAPSIPLTPRTLGHVLSGGVLGAAEGLVFAYGAESPSGRDYAGAGLVGAGLGAGLGLASGMSSELGTGKGLATAGMAAWGTWMGGFAGAFAPRLGRARGGLVGLNVGGLVGYGLLRADWIAPQDFGWLSLAGALGTALGGGVGALFSDPNHPAPVFAGLAVGPLLGLGAGTIALPRLRRPEVAAHARRSSIAGFTMAIPAVAERDSTQVLAGRSPSFLGALADELSPLRHLFDVASWSPLVGALPPAAGDAQPAPFIFGVQGTLR